ncbi:lipocalin-like domain-containing protein [Terriglobus sp. TAA 43]|uniref:lipocalin-like domain-containing protein n=1 Tax=Terriglobus sp. TAA 43 TaxID=278961 RepID=UPI0006454B4D|nr:lipocalin-like domain-containing protein [Terriglobus sp. TAA 43]
MKNKYVSLLASAMLFVCALNGQEKSGNPFVGSWQLIAADKLLPNGTRVSDYGAEPHGMAVFTADGHFMIDVFRNVRTKFASKDREKGTFDEYKEAQLSSSCSFGTYTVDAAANKITLHIDRSTYPNGDDTTQVREYEVEDDTLSWKVAPRPDGSIPITVVRRIAP